MFRPSARAWALSAILTSSVFRVAAAESVTVTLDQARLIRLPAAISTLVIGNPLIADATLQKGGVAILTGKGYGTTNFAYTPVIAYTITGMLDLSEKMYMVPRITTYNSTACT